MRSLQSLVAATLVLVANVSSQDLTVELDQGIIQGSVGSTVSGVTFYSFLGIPYSQPPVGELRFKAPQGAPSWTGVRDASTLGSNCFQVEDSEVHGSEDCLFINVYTPQLPRVNHACSLMPVMVWIHGGGLVAGSGDPSLYGPGYLLDREIVFVTFNYRLGVLGFLGLSHSEVSLNNGLKDQRAALRWVQQNIEKFGGDPARTTIFGESSGASSVEYFMLSPSTSGLFQRAISQSGSVLNPWAYVDTASAQTRAQQLTQLLGYSAEDNDIYNFLMGASAENITIQQSNVTTERRASESLAFVPTAEKETGSGGEVFLPASPLEILKSGNFTHVPYLTGFCSAEGKFLVSTIMSDTWDKLNNDFESFLPYDLNLTIGTTESQHAAALVKKTYFGNQTASIANVEQYIKLDLSCFQSNKIHDVVDRDLGEGLNLTWDPVEESKQTYLDINTDLSVHNLLELHPERRAVWDALYSDVDN
uniref:Carboxylesterase type B domain-containing protein n=1 Tax=Timema monikensis TaxID=170555 RepID=A0A7R9E0I9_9NEOP|nr:unnamed protein product [Timema monikensis]